MLGTEKEKNRSGTEKEKKRSGTEKEKNRPGTEKEKKRSGTEKGKKRKELTEAHTPPKETVKDEIVVCELGKKRKVSVKHWNGGIRIDIREYYIKDGKQMPTQKGTSLTMSKLMMVRDHIGKIDNALNEDS